MSLTIAWSTVLVASANLRQFRRRPCGRLGMPQQAAICHQSCNRTQCREHKILLRRMYNSDTDQVTIVKSSLEKVRYGILHPGIPSSCKLCTQDVKEHQVFHLVSRTLCKFCRWEMRTMEWTEIPVTTTSLYKHAFEGI